MKKSCLIFILGVILVAITRAQTYTSFHGAFGQPTQQISELTDAFFKAADRFTVTPNLPGLFEGRINDAVWQIAAGVGPTILTVDLISKGELGPTGLTYPEGNIYLSFYSSNTPQTVSGRVKNSSGVWTNMGTWTNVSNNGSYMVMRGTVPVINYVTMIEITVTPKTTTPTWVSKVEYHRWRADAELTYAYFSKYTENKLQNDLSFTNSANALTLKLKKDGGAYFGNNVGIGTTITGTYKLAVEGTIGARKIKVTTSPWADFVFDKNYKLPTLQEVEKFISTNHHLPGVPSAAVIEKEGVDLGDTQVLLLQKIEELTLYLIEQNKKIERQQQELNNQGKEIEQLKKKLKKG